MHEKKRSDKKMTEEEANALDRISADYIMTRAMATNKMPLQILSEMVHDQIIHNSGVPAHG
ncbi:hypothetical protein AGMMS49942_23550 [Spirochaetia bacterium]|nr:hypothetical protein AGMMS49942_23550 [Spirochaetia bacterium]